MSITLRDVRDIGRDVVDTVALIRREDFVDFARILPIAALAVGVVALGKSYVVGAYAPDSTAVGALNVANDGLQTLSPDAQAAFVDTGKAVLQCKSADGRTYNLAMPAIGDPTRNDVVGTIGRECAVTLRK